jgi:hypothetical protein
MATMAHAGTRTPLFLLLGAEPPVLVRDRGCVSLEDANSSELESVLLRANNEHMAMEWLVELIQEAGFAPFGGTRGGAKYGVDHED